MFCSKCGSPIKDGCGFCSNCGAPVPGIAPKPAEVQAPAPEIARPYTEPAPSKQPSAAVGTDYVKKGVETFVNTINEMTGESGEVEVQLKDLFSEVLKKHSKEERDTLFICGTAETTPDEAHMVSEWPKPWLYSRVFLSLTAVFFLLYLMLTQFYNINAYPGLMFIGAMIVPFSFMVFLWETNVPRNIPIWNCVYIFFVGGSLSLILTLILDAVLSGSTESFLGAIIIGLVEETAKAAVAVYYLRKHGTRYILNGLLIGACVGAGFAVFETAGYAFQYLIAYGYADVMMRVLLTRAFLAIGGHVVWTAIAAAGFVAANRSDTFNSQTLYNPNFLKFYGLCVLMHALWDAPINFFSSIYLVQILLTIVALVIMFIQMSAGLRQISRFANEAVKQE